MPTRPLTRDRGHLPIEDHGLIGDGATCALVARDGSIPWLCLPDFDSPPFLAGLLDHERGGEFSISMAGLETADQRYLDDTGVLLTELHGPDGVVEITDCLTLRAGADLTELVPAGRSELLRLARVVSGSAELTVRLRPRDDVQVRPEGGGWALSWPAQPDLRLTLWSSHPLEVADDGSLGGTVTLRAGDPLTVALHWSGNTRLQDRQDPAALVHQTATAWRAWAGRIRYEGPQRRLVRRSAITLKLLDHAPTGAIMAAATSSLPEEVGGVRNWDYRYTWVRDASFSVYALRRIGLTTEADSFLAWTLTNAERDGGPKIMYALDGGQPPEEWEDPALRGWRDSGPVHWGNGAAGQTQHDVYGELMDVAHQWTTDGGVVDAHLWEALHALAEQAIEMWTTPDQGIWEIRGAGRPFTYSVAMCQVAVDRALQIAERCGLDHPRERWTEAAREMRAAVLERSWDDERGTFTEHLAEDGEANDGGLDGSLLALPLRGVVPFDDPRMVATVEKVREHLDAGDGLLYRYLHSESDDGLPGQEGAFLLCSFWLVDNLTGQGRLDEAEALYDSLCARATPLGLLSEEIDPRDGSFLGNFPQAFSHLGVIASGWKIAQARRAEAGRR
ncbi:glycoside hydrolase family 15 protein [Geodermatophilus sp. Leaf369]|uniref:glycoside hydrolase family 15 protein n=1 Tax=Geodermatophilus sp. Leaf369 TaxID=1736354 RepID=UPI0009E8FEDA|nr:glycoside hydrolase family 15 protein [Geodermatophilus sp. Leaf369]